MKLFGLNITKAKQTGLNKPEMVNVKFLNDGKTITVKAHDEVIGEFSSTTFYPILGFDVGNEIPDEVAIKKGYLGNTEVYANVNKISKTVQSLPIALMQGDTKIEEGDLHDYIFRAINKKQGLKNILYEATVYLLLTGDAYIWKRTRSYGFPAELHVLPSQAMRPYKRTYGVFDPVLYYEYTDGGKINKLFPDEIIHVQNFNPSLYGRGSEDGLSPLTPGRSIMDAANNLTIADKSIFENGGANTLVAAKDVSLPMLPDDVEKLKQGIKQSRGTAKDFNTLIPIQTAIDVHRIGLTPEELELFDSNLRHLRAICNIFGTDSSLFNDPDNKTFNNRKEAERSLYMDVVIPTAEQLLEGLWRDFLNEIDMDLWLKIEVTEIEALNPSPVERQKIALDEVLRGVIKIDEYRERYGMPPMPKKGDDKPMLAQILGVGGTQALISVLSDVNLTRQQKVESLIILFGLSPEDAEKMVGEQEMLSNENK